MAEIAGLLGGYGSEDNNSVQGTSVKSDYALLTFSEHTNIYISNLLKQSHYAEPSPVPKTSPPPTDDDEEEKQAHHPPPDDDSNIPTVAAIQQLEDHPSTKTSNNHTNLPLDPENIPLKNCDPALASRVASWLQVQRTHGRNLKEELRKMRDYRNPEFFKKMVEYLEIEPYASAFSPEVFDPEGIREEDRLEELRRQWKEEEERRRMVRNESGRVEFVKSSSGSGGGEGGGKDVQKQQQQKGGGSDVQQAIAAASARARALALQLEQRAKYNNRP